jgi:hypothetical protein
MPDLHVFDQWFERYKRGSPSPMSREDALSVWNALLDTAVEEVGIAKDQFVFDRKYEAAAIARDVQQLIMEMKVDEGRAAAR